MKTLSIYFILVISLLSSCKNTETKDTSEVNNLMSVIDSLLLEVTNKQDHTLADFYRLTEDSLKVDSLSKVMDLSDTLGFYQLLERDVNDLNEFVLQTKKEINFARDQLISVKTEYLENKITEIEFEKEIDDVDQMIGFLKGRVDTNMMLINKRYKPIFNSLNDTTQNEESE